MGRSSGEGNGNPLQYFCLENPMDRGAWRATVRGVVESDTAERPTHTFQAWLPLTAAPNEDKARGGGQVQAGPPSPCTVSHHGTLGHHGTRDPCRDPHRTRPCPAARTSALSLHPELPGEGPARLRRCWWTQDGPRAQEATRAHIPTPSRDTKTEPRQG